MANHMQNGKLRKRAALRWLLGLVRPVVQPRTLFLLSLGLSTALVGCTRKYYRDRADIDGLAMIHEKDHDPRWTLPYYFVYPDPRARFADWTDPDHPPMPPDDPAARALSPAPQRPDRRAGVAYLVGMTYLEILAAWDKENRDRQAEEAKAGERGIFSEAAAGAAGEQKEDKTVSDLAVSAIPNIDNELTAPVAVDRPLPLPKQTNNEDCQKPYLITLEQSVEFATFNSRELQTQRENVFLAALPVTLERFAFAPQFFAIENVFRQRFGSQTADGPANQWQANSTVGFSKLFSTGGLILAQFANQTVVNLGNLNMKAPVKTVSTSTISLDAVQPLLRGGGQAVTLEPLTQAERNLLYTVRDFARYEQQFYAYIASGTLTFIPGISAGVPAISPGAESSPSAFSPNATPVVNGVGGPNISPQVVPGEGQRLFPTPIQTPIPQGYLPTVQNKAVLIVQYQNVQRLRRFLDLFRVYLEGGLVNPVQVVTVELNLLQAIEGVLGTQAGYRINLDELKIQLGLPTNLPIDVDDTPLRPIFRQIHQYEENSRRSANVSAESLRLNQPNSEDRLRGDLHKLLTSSELVQGTNFQKEAPKRWDVWEKLPPTQGVNDPVTQRLDRLLEERRKLLDLKSELEAKRQDLSPDDARRLNDLDIEIVVGRFERELRRYEAAPWRNSTIASVRETRRGAQFMWVHRAFLTLMEGAFMERQNEVRGSWPNLPPACVDGVNLLSADDDEAMGTITRAALENRLDLMNQRAELVDAWRKIRVAANALLGTLNVEYHLDSSTPPELAKPFDFSGSRTNHELIFNAQPPIVRIVERNNYRSTLINFQQQRRALMSSEDQVLYAVRLDIRNLRAQANNYQRIQKRALELAYSQVDQALEAFNQPAIPTGPDKIPGFVGPPIQTQQGDPAALTNQLLNAQSTLVRWQSDLYSLWLSYLNGRIYLYRDMGLMPLDARGVWLDEIASCDCKSNDGSGPPGPSGVLPEGQQPQRLPEPRQFPAATGAPPEQ
jgi:hypothetical protein